MTHFEEMLAQHDKETARILSIQVRNEQAESFGAFVEENGFIDTRHCGFLLAHLPLLYSACEPSCKFYFRKAMAI